VRKYLYLAATVAASAAVVALPATSASAAGHVLTIKKTGGTAVKVGAVLKASLVTGTSAVFSLGTEKLTCKAAKFSAKVTANPVKPGTAKESLTAQSFSKCKVTGIAGVTFKSLKVKNLPYKATVSDAKGFPVKVTGQSKTKPILVTVTVTFGGNDVVCSFKAASVSGHALNKGSKITFSKQKFTKTGGALCPASANFTAAFGPVVDSSVSGSPKVFVN
jgi:hypothetical protein